MERTPPEVGVQNSKPHRRSFKERLLFRLLAGELRDLLAYPFLERVRS